jgi:hypothetical protein
MLLHGLFDAPVRDYLKVLSVHLTGDTLRVCRICDSVPRYPPGSFPDLVGGRGMSFVMAAPELVASAASALADLGSTINAAHSAAALSTTGTAAAAADEVSAASATLNWETLCGTTSYDN